MHNFSKGQHWFHGVARPTVLCLLVASGMTTLTAFAQQDERENHHWEVEVALYGQNDHFVDVTRRVEMARREGELDLLVNNENLGVDPLPNVPKRLVVLFRIGERRFGVSVPENEHLYPPPVVRRIIAASYHARDMQPKAFCQNGCMNVTDLVRDRLRDGVLEIMVSNQELRGDPAVNVPKQLTVRFLVGREEEREATAEEGSVLRIPEFPEGDHEVVRMLADYREHHRDRDHDRDRDPR